MNQEKSPIPTSEDLRFYQEALKEAKKGLAMGGIPIGAVLSHQGRIIGRGHNQRIQMGSSIRHGETDCLENAGRQKTDVYLGATLYTTLSPCAMCTGAALLYKIPRIVIGENVNFKGEEDLLKSRGVQLIILHDQETIKIMKHFIDNNNELWNEDIASLPHLTTD